MWCSHTVEELVGQKSGAAAAVTAFTSATIMAASTHRLVTGHWYTYIFWDLLSQHNSSWKMAPIFLPNCVILADHKLHPKP